MSGTGPADAQGADPVDDGRAGAEVPDVWVVTAAEVRTARLLVTAQFVLLGLIALLPGGWG